MEPLINKKLDINLKTIIFATDFSLCSQNAGLYSALLAKHFSAKLLVAHAFTLSQAAMEAEIDHSLVSRQREDLLSMLSRKAHSLAEGSIQASPALVEGAPEEAVPALAEANAPSMIVLGTHGGGWIEREFIGSVAEKILRSTRCPCLTVGPKVRPLTAATLPFRRVLYATDFTSAAAHTAAYAVSFTRAFGANIDVAHLVRDEEEDDPKQLERLSEKFYKEIADAVPYDPAQFCRLTTLAEGGNPHRQILHYIDQHEIDLLVLGVEKTSQLGFLMRASGGFSLILDATCPVLTLTG